MSRESSNENLSVFTSLSKASFGIAAMAFVASISCAAINSTLSGWMAVAGMAGLGLFYLALGVLNLGPGPQSQFSHDLGATQQQDRSRNQNRADKLDRDADDQLVEV